MQWIALILGAAGSVVSVAQSRWCYVIWTFPNVYWSWYNWHNGERVQALVFVLMFWTCLIGWLAWGRAKRTTTGCEKGEEKEAFCKKCGSEMMLCCAADVKEMHGMIAELTCNDRILRNRGDTS